jgi:arginyl-tRNA synthetase
MKSQVQNQLSVVIKDWSATLGIVVDTPVAVEFPPSNVPGDLASNWPLTAAKRLKMSPRQTAQEVIARWVPGGPVRRVEIAGPGFLNFHLDPAWMAGELARLVEAGPGYTRRPPAGEKTLLEFVSANPTGPLHVGHGRGAALGDALARLLRHRGHDVTTEYYVNDVGNQTDNLALSVMRKAEELAPGTLTAEEKTLSAGAKAEDLYRGDYVAGVARDILRTRGGPGRPAGMDFFRRESLSRLLKAMQEDLSRFGVSFDRWYSESTLYENGSVDRALARLDKDGHLKTEAGALWFLSTRFGDDKDRVLKRGDERPTYFASDIAYHLDKLERGYQRLINIWGADHHGYVARVKAALKALGRDPDRLTIVLNQLVSLLRGGKPVAMGKRSGEFVTLKDVVDEVGRDAARFFFALRGPTSALEFDLDLAKKQAKDNPVYYVKYVHARCCSLFKEAARLSLDGQGPLVPPAELHPAERALLVKTLSFPDVLDQCVTDLSPHHLTAYLRELAGAYHRFYEACRVLDPASPGVSRFRLTLAGGVKSVIHTGLDLLAVTAPEEM